MKCIDSCVVGVFIGFLLCCLLFCAVKAFDTAKPKPSVCEVNIGYQDGKQVHVRYGVVIGEM